MDLAQAPAPVAASTARADLPLGLAVGLLTAGASLWFPVAAVVAVPVLVVVLVRGRRRRQLLGGLALGAATPVAASAFWRESLVLALVALVVAVLGLALALGDPAPDPEDAPGLVGPAVAGVLAGVFAGFVLLSFFALVGYLPLVAVLAGVTWYGGRAALPWIVLGAAAVPWWIGAQNWGGPGMRCGSDADSSWCNELSDPAPWLLGAAVVTLLGAAALAWQLRHRASA